MQNIELALAAVKIKLTGISGGKLRNAHLLLVHLQNREKYFGSAKERIFFRLIICLS
jgi:hypothetical protein